MVRHSVLVPLCWPDETHVHQVEAIAHSAGRLCGTFEVVTVCAGSGAGQAARLVRGARDWHRVLRLDGAVGVSAALSAGLAAARGELVVAMEPGEQYRPEQIPWLLARLARADLVMGCRQRSRWIKVGQALGHLPRRLLTGLDARDPDCLFWAARREAVAGIELAPGMHRFLASLVAMRGYRVAEAYVDHRSGAGRSHGREAWPSLGNLLATWWLARCWKPYQAHELCLDAETAAVVPFDRAAPRDRAA